VIVDPHGDHRIAMALAPIGLVVPGLAVDDPGVVDKTWPGFWAMLDDLAG
jgi:3-phosphoshikimate 1-carboxyvinyltransferase